MNEDAFREAWSREGWSFPGIGREAYVAVGRPGTGRPTALCQRDQVINDIARVLSSVTMTPRDRVPR